jgi:hypothetical protein
LEELYRNRGKNLSLKQEDIIEMSCITSKTIYLIETGKSNSPIEYINRTYASAWIGMEMSIDIKKFDP